jgi:hypothetical protein
MELVKQFSVFLINKPGILAQVSRQLAQAKINVLAMTMMDSSEHGVLRLVASNPDKLRKTLAELNLPTTETDVAMVELTNKPGALADVCGKLAAAHVNINYAYCTTGARSGKAKAIFKVADMKKAQKVLNNKKPAKRRDMTKKLRRPAVLR